MTLNYQALEFTHEFLESFGSRDFSSGDRKRFIKAVDLLVENERHRSLRVHQLKGDQRGLWSASASRELRITFERLDSNRKRLLTCSRHYDR